MPLTTPTPQTWTLRLKSHRTTVLLVVNPTSTFTSIKQELLSALHTTNPSLLLHGTPIPSSAADVEFARFVDSNKPDLGWVSLDAEAENADEELFEEEGGDVKPKGKGKGRASLNGKASGGLTDCPRGAGLRDGAAVAFRFRGAAKTKGTAEKEAGLGVDEGFVDADDDDEDGVDGWDVVLPQYEDVYGIGELQPDDEIVTPKPNKFADFAAV